MPGLHPKAQQQPIDGACECEAGPLWCPSATGRVGLAAASCIQQSGGRELLLAVRVGSANSGGGTFGQSAAATLEVADLLNTGERVLTSRM